MVDLHAAVVDDRLKRRLESCTALEPVREILTVLGLVANEDAHHVRAVIPTIISQALKGDQIKLGKVSTKRDFLYVTDTVEAVLKTISSNKSLLGEEINLGTNHTFKVSEIVKLVSSILKKKLVLTLNKQKLRPKASEVEILKCDFKKAKQKLNWKPKFIGKKGFKAALIMTIAWYKVNINNELLNSKNLNRSYK